MVRPKETKLGRPRANKCESCRRRHIRCDFLEPVCTPCRKDKFSCERGSVSRASSPSERALTIGKKSARRVGQLTSRPSVSILPITIDENIWFCHLYATLALPSEWIGFRAALQPRGGLASGALNALSCAYFGRSTHRLEFVQQGGDQYTTCLRRVNERLGDRTQNVGSDTLLAVTILGYFESLLSTARFAWCKHYLGLARLLELAGPSACRDPVVFNVYVHSRFMMVLAALASGVTTCFAHLEWKTLPWEIMLQSKGGMDILLDSLADLAHARSAPASQTGITTAMMILQNLDEWRRVWMSSLQTDFSDSTDRQPLYPPAWPAPLICPTLNKANCYCLYHATSILAAEHAAAEMPLVNEGSWYDSSALAQTQHNSAVEICRTLEYHFTSNSGPLGSLYILWPIRMAFKVLKNGNHEEVAWIHQQIEKYFTNQGVWEIQQDIFDGL